MKWGHFELLYWLPLAIPLAWALFALLRRRRRALRPVARLRRQRRHLAARGAGVARRGAGTHP
jgi:heme exporter protein D